MLQNAEDEAEVLAPPAIMGLAMDIDSKDGQSAAIAIPAVGRGSLQNGQVAFLLFQSIAWWSGFELRGCKCYSQRTPV